MKRPKVGIYYYPWYNERRWNEAPVPFTPTAGRYDSTDPSTVARHLDELERAGIDYLVFEQVPEGDWCFPVMRDATDIAVGQLRERGLEWSFLIDSLLTPGPVSALEDVADCVSIIERSGWTDGLVRGPQGLPMLMAFSPMPENAKAITRRYADRYQMVYPAYLPHWGPPDKATRPEAFSPYAEGAAAAGQTIDEHLTPLGFITFWQATEEVINHAGFCAVEPGYDDLLLGREPQLAPVVDRRQGEHYRRRLQQALDTDPEHILIYSFNEYFEGSTIEPTLEYGHRYLDITREFTRSLDSRESEPGGDH